MVSTIIPLGGVAPSELIVVVAIALLLFGGKKIPELMKGLGTGIKEFKQATRETNTTNAIANENAQEQKSNVESTNEPIK
ncbi:twin-arginine translocase TatA/TatE family subunit [Myroides odoratimimus]|uniref:Sec-independent protein translocase protein TatA n=1 Tax=Myroides odoratimimus CCUG 10230 TaxID=883150 RepID=A0ABP2NA29_9FLAO|nr:twin-arginine translocase TatA/TatE family subunit [Myroides odoratimimus]EHO08478.1 TatA/E family twin arginine-targeting protein translocase [Myroides odoratimimus CCUG 10230]MDM1410308.1 twin-arginine translocase TatA/TatE family subunit [Myroides odoratimimus]MDM1414640.1 twin-arginine translocase TatA/TatE family subunit [Myroides odoratimimus]MDM1446634.1 twin-arginine translocase TatA/TatE family subunit [Myroides odoratimimus]MDM1448540.1 twin-arginine translocase TatA/TatE family s